MEMIEILQELGIAKNEAAVYMLLAKSGGMNASDVAAASGINRPNVYDLLKRLENKGFVGSFTLNGKTFYKSASASQIRGVIQKKLEHVDLLSKQLDKYEEPQKETEIVMYSGKKILRILEPDIIETSIKENLKESLVFSVNEKEYFGLDTAMMNWLMKKLKEHKLKERILVAQGDDYLPFPKETTEYRSLPKEYLDTKTSMIVYGHKVAIIIFSEIPYLILIKSRTMAKSYKDQFEFLWKKAKKIKR